MDGSLGLASPLPPALMPLEVLEDQITQLSAHIAAATFRLLSLLREFDARGGWSGDGLRSCAHWLNWRCGVDLGAAREKLRVAHALPALPLISAAFERGEVSYSKVRAMTRVATPWNEESFLNVARHGTAHHVERLVRLYRRQLRVEDANRPLADRYLRYYEDDDGCLVIHGRIPAEQGELFRKALDAAEQVLRDEEAKRGPDAPPTVALVDHAGRARQADALALLAETFLAKGPGELAGGEHYQVVVHVAAETSCGDESATAAVSPVLGSGDGSEIQVAAETCRRIGCDCSLVHVTENAAGEPLDVGRRTRSIPPAIMRALRLRDKGCRFPGCTCTRWVDGHHIRHWADGGETKLSNLVLLCRFHHRLVHEGGFSIRVLDDGAPQFVRPNRAAIPLAASAVEPPLGYWPELEDENLRFGIEIGPRTITSRWLGEQMDYDIALEGLAWRDRHRAARTGPQVWS